MTTSESMPISAATAVLVIDTRGDVIGLTPGAEELLGYRAAEVLNRSGALLIMPERAAAWDAGYGGHETWSGFAEFRHRDGTRILGHVEGTRLVTPGEEPAWLVAVTPATAGASGRACSWVEPLIRRTPVAMAIWDHDLRCVWLNTAAERLRTVFPWYRLGRSLAEPLPGTHTEAMQETARQVLASGVPHLDRETRWTSPDRREDRTLSTSLCSSAPTTRSRSRGTT